MRSLIPIDKIDRTKFAIEVEHPIRGWVRLGGRYSSKSDARSWYPFIRGAWHGLPLRTVKVERLK